MPLRELVDIVPPEITKSAGSVTLIRLEEGIMTLVVNETATFPTRPAINETGPTDAAVILPSTIGPANVVVSTKVTSLESTIRIVKSPTDFAAGFLIPSNLKETSVDADIADPVTVIVTVWPVVEAEVTLVLNPT